MSSGVRALFRKLLSESVFLTVRIVKKLFSMPDGTCRYQPTCSQFTREALVALPLHKAIPRIIKRVSSCHPKGGFGYDPVIKKSKKEQCS